MRTVSLMRAAWVVAGLLLPGAAAKEGAPVRRHGGKEVKLAKLANFCKILAGSFSAVSKRIFASKYAFDSIFQDLQDVQTFAPLQIKKTESKIV